MADWLTPVRVALDRRHTPLPIFFRDDDAGWNDTALHALLDCFADHGQPVDLAVIPAALTDALASALCARIDRGESIGLHQHGFDHDNHQTEGRRCEFGNARSREQQHGDIAAGLARLRQRLGPHLSPFFTPPWNRCTQDTAEVLNRLGFKVLSQDHTATPLQLGGLKALPVHVDWCKWARDDVSAESLAAKLADAMGMTEPCGIMLHHAAMDADDLARLDALLATLGAHPNAALTSMRALAPHGMAEVV